MASVFNATPDLGDPAQRWDLPDMWVKPSASGIFLILPFFIGLGSFQSQWSRYIYEKEHNPVKKELKWVF